MDERKAVPGENIIVEGESGNELFVVEEGVLDCYKVLVFSFDSFILLIARQPRTKTIEIIRTW